jgi:hypothetical protein
LSLFVREKKTRMTHDYYPKPMAMQRHAQNRKAKEKAPPEKPALPELSKDPDNPLQLPEEYESDRAGRDKPK